MRDALDRDPATLIKTLSVPVLALYGSLDSQVPPAKHADLMRAALAGKPPHTQVVELKGLNHLLQPAKTGLPGEYGDIEITMDPEAIALITNWIKTQTAD
jgi:pimeloyl-ACP methyl ester carboxylesterase